MNNKSKHYDVTNLALLCTDVACFSSMTVRLGDKTALQVLNRAEQLTATIAGFYGGRLWETRGDGSLFTFLSPGAAVAAAVAMQKLVSVDPVLADIGLRLRMAIHAGPFFQLYDRVFGLNVILAFRLCDAAKAGEILVSGEVHAALSPRLAATCQARGEAHLKGITQAVTCSRVEWTEVVQLPKEPIEARKTHSLVGYSAANVLALNSIESSDAVQQEVAFS